MNGRTYCGHYKGHYLKSTLEYIYARYLDHMGLSWDYEVKTFDLPNGGSYKPDFDLGTHYVEVKGNFNFEADLPRVKTFESQYGATVVVLQEKEIRQLIAKTPLVFEQLRREWKSQAIGLGMDTSGKNNPRYGVKFDQSTKDKISSKAKSRMQDPAYKAKWVESRRQSEKVQQNIQARAEWAKAQKREVCAVCEWCGNQFEVKFRKSSERRFCSYSCSGKGLFSKTGAFPTLQSVAQQFAADYAEQILSAKVSKIRPALQPFYDTVKELCGIVDERTIAKGLLGRAANRKELLQYFQALAENVLRATAKTEAVELEDKEPLG